MVSVARQPYRALQIIEDLRSISTSTGPASPRPSYSRRCASSASTSPPTPGASPDYGERHRTGETISTSFVESTVNQVISKRMVKKHADALEPPH
jgi:transglutaminase/protease-like cytokinesis protein 3